MILQRCVVFFCLSFVATVVSSSEIDIKFLESAPQKRPLYGLDSSPLGATAESIMRQVEQHQPDLIATKTFRDKPYPFRTRTIVSLENEKKFDWDDLEKPLYAARPFSTYKKSMNIANSVGMPSPSQEKIRWIVLRALALLKNSRTQLIFSVHGSSIEGFCAMARLAKEVAVPFVSANLSCPNIEENSTGLLYKDPITVGKIVAGMKAELGAIPLIVKVGIFKLDEQQLLEDIMMTLEKNGAYAIHGINSVPVRVINRDGSPTFGPGRETCGISGPQIFQFTQSFVDMAHEIVCRKKLLLKLFVGGGVSKHGDFDILFKKGALAVFAATGPLCNQNFTFPLQNRMSRL